MASPGEICQVCWPWLYGIHDLLNIKDQWIWWAGPAIAALLLALMYNLIPPHPREKAASNSQPTLPVMRPKDEPTQT